MCALKKIVSLTIAFVLSIFKMAGRNRLCFFKNIRNGSRDEGRPGDEVLGLSLGALEPNPRFKRWR